VRKERVYKLGTDQTRLKKEGGRERPNKAKLLLPRDWAGEKRSTEHFPDESGREHAVQQRKDAHGIGTKGGFQLLSEALARVRRDEGATQEKGNLGRREK